MFSKTLPAMVATVFACGCRLTVDEHIWFYGRLKGLSAAAVGPEQDHLLRDIGLVPKRHTQTRHLSGEPSLGRTSRSGWWRGGWRGGWDFIQG